MYMNYMLPVWAVVNVAVNIMKGGGEFFDQLSNCYLVVSYVVSP
jgi:hypothetical protein